VSETEKCPRCETEGCPSTLLVRSALASMEHATRHERSLLENSIQYLQAHARADIACSLRALPRIAEALEKLFKLRLCEACAAAAASEETGVDAALVAAIQKVFGEDFDVATGRRKAPGPHA